MFSLVSSIAHLISHQPFNRETRAVKDKLQFSHSHKSDINFFGTVPF
jgi:hypothetical protein